jgi:hypothetical protein
MIGAGFIEVLSGWRAALRRGRGAAQAAPVRQDRPLSERPRRRRSCALQGLLIVAVALFAAAATHAQDTCQRTNRFPELWDRLDAARAYRGGFAENMQDGDNITRRRTGNKSYTELLEGYPMPGAKGEFLALLDEFGARLADPNDSVVREATCGFRETLSEIMAGEALLGNRRLLQGLRARYPVTGQNGDPPDPSQLSLLTQSNDIFRGAVELAGDRIRQGPARLRSRGTVNQDFPFFTENTPRIAGTQGEVVEDDYFRFTDLLTRYGLAGNSLGKRMFFFGNDEQEGRDEAAAVFQGTAQAIYLSDALLAAAQSPRDFQDNLGAEVKRQVTDAQRVFDDIRAGFNPLSLQGDFVPTQSVDNLMNVVSNALALAQTKEAEARDSNREYDEIQTTLAEELRDQREEYLDQIDALLGIEINEAAPTCAPPAQSNCLARAEDREKLVALARDATYLCGPQVLSDPLDCSAGCAGAICSAYRDYVGAQIDLRETQRSLMNFTEQIRIEEERSGAVTRTIGSAGNSFAALDVAQGIAAAVIPDITVGTEFAATFKPSEAVVGALNSAKTLLETQRDVQLEQTDSAATIKNLLLEQATQAVRAQRAALAVVEARSEYTASVNDLVRLVRNTVSAREDLSQAYFTNPAYRLQLELAQQNADATFENGMVSAYRVTKFLEYEWAERYSNPIMNQDTGLPISIGGGGVFDPIVRAESVFTVASAGSAGSAEPSLQTYVAALQQWDSTLRDNRGPNGVGQDGQPKVISLKEDIFGLDSPDEAFNRLAFRDLIAKSRVRVPSQSQDDLVLEFPIQIGDLKIFEAVANLKIVSLGVNLVTVPGRMLTSNPTPNNPPLVDLVMLDQATIRTFFSDFPANDDFLFLQLEGARNFRQSRFAALSVQATIDGQGNVAPNIQLANRSPAVSRWQLRIQGALLGNRDLQLENLDDIQLRITYKFGQPPEFTFPEF